MKKSLFAAICDLRSTISSSLAFQNLEQDAPRTDWDKMSQLVCPAWAWTCRMKRNDRR